MRADAVHPLALPRGGAWCTHLRLSFRPRPRRPAGHGHPAARRRRHCGRTDRFLLIGTILTPEQVIEGRVLVEGAKITCVAAGADYAMRPGAAGTTIIDTRGIIALGMIDTHNHILFDIDGAAHAVARRLRDR